MKKLTTIASVLLLASTTFVYAGNDPIIPLWKKAVWHEQHVQ